MSFLDDLDKKLNQLGQGAVKKTKGATDSMRLTSMLREEENKQNALYKQMGMYFYDTYGSVAEGPLKDLCDHITASKQTIENLQKQISIVKGVKFCPSCHAEFPANTMFCNRCGTRLPELVQPQMKQPVVNGRVCLKCGTPLSPGQLFCTHCGNKVADDSPSVMPVSEPEQSEVPFEDTVDAQPVFEEEPIDILSQNENVQAEAEMFEEARENSIQLQAPSEEVTPFEPIAVEQKKICPSCGMAAEDEQVFCIHCGTRL